MPGGEIEYWELMPLLDDNVQHNHVDLDDVDLDDVDLGDVNL